MWILFAFGSALFAGLTSILAKCGIRKTDSTVATAIRTAVVLLLAWGIVFATGVHQQISSVSQKSWTFLVLSGLATGGSWLFFYKALQLGSASRVVPVDKFSVVLVAVIAFAFLGERPTGREWGGIALITTELLLLAIKR